MLCSMATKAPNKHIRWVYKLFHAWPKSSYLMFVIISVFVLLYGCKFFMDGYRFFFLPCETRHLYTSYSTVVDKWEKTRVDVYNWCNEHMISYYSGELRFCFSTTTTTTTTTTITTTTATIITTTTKTTTT